MSPEPTIIPWKKAYNTPSAYPAYDSDLAALSRRSSTLLAAELLIVREAYSKLLARTAAAPGGDSE
jgi:hypothetical protein